MTDQSCPELKQDGLNVSIDKIQRGFTAPSLTVCHKPAVEGTERFALPRRLKPFLWKSHRSVTKPLHHSLDFNKAFLQYLTDRWQVRKRPVGFSPRMPAFAIRSHYGDERWATNPCDD